MDENSIATSVVDCALEIHKELGPGLLESVYEVLLTDALRGRGLSVDRQRPIPIHSRGKRFDEGFRADLVVGERGSGRVEIRLIPRPRAQKASPHLLATLSSQAWPIDKFWRRASQGQHRTARK